MTGLSGSRILLLALLLVACATVKATPHLVTLSPYEMTRTEVTVAQYSACVDAGNCSQPVYADDPQCNWGKPGKERHPVNCLDWKQAKAFCEAQGARLPTEAQWEFAARGTDGREYPWGDQYPTDILAYNARFSGTAPVGGHPAGASPFGVQDMVGSVCEMVEDVYADYPAGASTDPRVESGPTAESNQYHVVRGCYSSGFGAPPVAATEREGVGGTGPVYGFRCARVQQKHSSPSGTTPAAAGEVTHAGPEAAAK